MPPEKGKRRDDFWRNARRDTVAERERSDEIVADCLFGIICTGICFGLPNLAALLCRAVSL